MDEVKIADKSIARGISLVLILLYLGSLSYCSRQLLTRTDYESSRELLNRGELNAVLANFPDGERGMFITTMEKAYLRLLSGKAEIDDLIAYAKKIDNQVRYKVSRELKSFFYLETPEGYYASEHEVIWMHMLLSWGYSLRNDFEKAAVEAKISSNLLSMQWSETGRFDDPLMRIILAGLWTMCGQWREAQVDFRKAADLAPSLKWARTLGNMNAAPAELILVLGGTGPEPVWDPSAGINPFRALRQVVFKMSGNRSLLSYQEVRGSRNSFNTTTDAMAWYQRHFIRNNEISDMIKDSHYSGKLLFSTVTGTVQTGAGIAAGVAIAAGGIALGGAIIVAGIYANSAELAALGIVPIVYGPVKGASVADKMYKDSIARAKEQMDVSIHYRYVRFLPEYAWVSWSMKPATGPIALLRYDEREKKMLPAGMLSGALAGKSKTRVVFGFVPDPKQAY